VVPSHWVPPSIKEEVTGEKTKTTTIGTEDTQATDDIHASPSSSSSFAPLPSDPELEPVPSPATELTAPVTAPRILAIHAPTQPVKPVETAATVRTPAIAPSVPASAAVVGPELAEAGVDRALMAALTLRVIALYGMSDRQARAKLEAAYRDASKAARDAGFRRFDPAWMDAGLDAMEEKQAKGKPFHWGILVGTLRNFAKEDGPTERKPCTHAPPKFDAAAWVAALARECGWTFKIVGPDQVKPVEIPDRTTADWSRGGLGPTRWEELNAHKAEIKAHVLGRRE
jgi:hypothetical protein